MKHILFFTLFMAVSFETFGQSATITQRKGFLFSFASGISNSQMTFPSKKRSFTDLALNWKIGYMINPKMALLLNGAVSIYDYDKSGRARKRDFGGLFPSLQYHLTEKFWILGGVGIGTDAPVFYDLKPDFANETNYYSGLGAIISIGYEFYKHKNFLIDIQARLNYGRVDLPICQLEGLNTGLLIGVNFY